MHQWTQLILYRASLLLLLAVFIGLLVVTPIDTILQSQSSGQFWNVIIIVVAYAITVVIALILYATRLVKTRRSLSDIPRRFIPRKDDLPKESGKLIEQELDRCLDIVNQTLPVKQHISHPGLMNPKISQGQFDAPYDQVIDTLNYYLELKTKKLYPGFKRPKGTPMREYIIWLIDYNVIDDQQTAWKFIQVYQDAKFSNQLITEEQFDEYMEVCVKLMFSIKDPDNSNNDPFDGSISNNSINNIKRYSTNLSPFATSHTALTNYSYNSDDDDDDRASVIVYNN